MSNSNREKMPIPDRVNPNTVPPLYAISKASEIPFNEFQVTLTLAITAIHIPM